MDTPRSTKRREPSVSWSDDLHLQCSVGLCNESFGHCFRLDGVAFADHGEQRHGSRWRTSAEQDERTMKGVRVTH
jgi:hypothetical protein